MIQIEMADLHFDSIAFVLVHWQFYQWDTQSKKIYIDPIIAISKCDISSSFIKPQIYLSITQSVFHVINVYARRETVNYGSHGFYNVKTLNTSKSTNSIFTFFGDILKR